MCDYELFEIVSNLNISISVCPPAFDYTNKLHKGIYFHKLSCFVNKYLYQIEILVFLFYVINKSNM